MAAARAVARARSRAAVARARAAAARARASAAMVVATAATGAATAAEVRVVVKVAGPAATAAAMAVKMGRIVDTAATIPADTGRFPPTMNPYTTNIPKTTSRSNIALVHTSAHRSRSTYLVHHSTDRLPSC